MNKNNFEELIFSYLDGEMSDSEIKDFKIALDKDPYLQEQLGNYEDMFNKMDKINYLNVSDNFMSHLNKKIYDIKNKKSILERFLDFELLGFNIRPVLGTSTVAFLIFGYFFYNLDLNSSSSNKMIIELNKGIDNGTLAITDEDSSSTIDFPDIEKQILKKNIKITSVKGNK